MHLVPNPYYWRGRPRIRVAMNFIPGATTAYDEYTAHKLDIMGAQSFPVDRVAQALKRPDVHVSSQLSTEYVLPNERKPPFNNVDVRRAFATAFDRTALVSQAYSEFPLSCPHHHAAEPPRI